MNPGALTSILKRNEAIHHTHSSRRNVTLLTRYRVCLRFSRRSVDPGQSSFTVHPSTLSGPSTLSLGPPSRSASSYPLFACLFVVLMFPVLVDLFFSLSRLHRPVGLSSRPRIAWPQPHAFPIISLTANAPSSGPKKMHLYVPIVFG